ncbi:PREDICTED: pheromone-binding protein Gp-9-like isoform X2 [Trachymyrmex cornetzi]|uniref:pheromone-binding protein Gp-9-like isoform X2 n=1 Tax=Trachymyrmex cornetzi TaxID=471704 RepID=UPI00084F71C2|nr:PREDICTED: pheromone-binding protein Gp-9-like isoform X2 [Trachymyrmex cornetzi]
MKSLVLYACILIIAPSSSIELKKIKNIIETTVNDVEACQAENNVTDADVYGLEDMGSDLPTQPENEERTRKMGCWIACALKRQNLMDEDSNINEPQIHVRINLEYGDFPDQAIVHRIGSKCMKEVRDITQECEKSFSLLVCAAKAVMEERKYLLNH